MSQAELVRDPGRADGSKLTESISEARVELYTTSYTHVLVAAAARGEVIDSQIRFQTDADDEFTAAIARLTNHRVLNLMSTTQTTPGVTCKRCFLDAAPLARRVGSGV